MCVKPLILAAFNFSDSIYYIILAPLFFDIFVWKIKGTQKLVLLYFIDYTLSMEKQFVTQTICSSPLLQKFHGCFGHLFWICVQNTITSLLGILMFMMVMWQCIFVVFCFLWNCCDLVSIACRWVSNSVILMTVFLTGDLVFTVIIISLYCYMQFIRDKERMHIVSHNYGKRIIFLRHLSILYYVFLC